MRSTRSFVQCAVTSNQLKLVNILTEKGRNHMSQADDLKQAMAMNTSYVTPAVITFVAYLFFWFPGLIFNIMYLQDARKKQQQAGTSLSGVGCLWILLIMNFVFPLIVCSLMGGISAIVG